MMCIVLIKATKNVNYDEVIIYTAGQSDRVKLY